MGKKNRKNKTRSGHTDNLGAPEAIAAHYAQLHSQQGERRRAGSSANTSRVNPDAERFAIKARIFKKAKQSKQAYELYTKAIGLDPYITTTISIIVQKRVSMPSISSWVCGMLSSD